MGKFKAILFDFDGLMFDTEKVWRDCFFEANKVFNLNFTDEDRMKCMGKREQVIRDELKKEHPYVNVDQYRDWLNFKVKEHINKFGAEKKKGLDNILNYIKQEDLLTGIVSGSSKNTILQILENGKVDESLFSSYVTSDLNLKSKPSPEPFVKCYEDLGVEAKHCVVLEDSYNGVKAGKNAGCFTIMIPDTLAVTEEMEYTADLILNDLDEVVEFLKSN